MSALVDIWTNEYAKLRENGQTLFSSGSGPFAAESSQVVLKNSTELCYMSGIVDKCTREFAKVREKGQALFSSGSTRSVESGQVVQPQERSSNGLIQAFVTRVNSTLLPCSEGSVSMLVQCFSP
ncbi:hypothetical protein COLO4_17778 [Corchorus olitorius]|uniref:Uncharacterized protein n=1 Tax=Corchorus olitorius TaxID=93759 RepID=A0A1R3JBF9_9ROSI|nr:hypothetical protein COLO4_17778 [Corchorus olitorius]